MSLSPAKFARSIALCSLLAVTLPAANLTVLHEPQGLNYGDKFRLIFLSGFPVTFNSSNVADYDQFVTNQAELTRDVDPLLDDNEISIITQQQLLSILGASGVTWQAIVSTPTVDARDHIGTFSTPVFRMDGLRVANNSADLWDGVLPTFGALINSVRYDQPGHEHNYPVWTGSNPDGTKFVGNELGTAAPRRGFSDGSGTNWFSDSNSAAFSSIYGISSEITFVPEPGTMVLTGLGTVALIAAARRQRQRAS